MFSIIRDPWVAVVSLLFRKIRKRMGCLNTSDLFTAKSVIGLFQRLVIDVERRLCQVPFQKSGQTSNALFETVKSCSCIFDGLLDDIAPDLFEPGIVFLRSF